MTKDIFDHTLIDKFAEIVRSRKPKKITALVIEKDGSFTSLEEGRNRYVDQDMPTAKMWGDNKKRNT